MIKALFLIFSPMAAWGRVVQARRGPFFIFGIYLLPMLLIVAAAEGYGLSHWGKSQSVTGLMGKITTGEAVVYETAQSLLTLVVIAVCAQLIKMLGDTFHKRSTYKQAFTVAVYGLSPVFLLRLLDAFPVVNPWLSWFIGIMLTFKILYHGVPMVMLPDPPHAFGLYFMSSLLLAMVTGLGRFITAWYLSGHDKSAEAFVSHLAAKLPF
jgi:hypothetical protein